MIEQTYATRVGECYLCGDVINVGDVIVNGDADDPYLHMGCLERDMEGES